VRGRAFDANCPHALEGAFAVVDGEACLVGLPSPIRKRWRICVAHRRANKVIK
jgi:hypothetical protein